MRIVNAKLEITDTSEINSAIGGIVGYWTCQLMGKDAREMMHGDNGMAIFGDFRMMDNGRIEYITSVWGSNGEIEHSYDSELCDDMKVLRNNEIEWIQ